ncbi:uncharacterized protein [Penaeus vannamei]|uniref:uncharacterized protein n=1 Tax=Penaeus vannamei TaxID=6689 RepID=UPI00387F4195
MNGHQEPWAQYFLGYYSTPGKYLFLIPNILLFIPYCTTLFNKQVGKVTFRSRSDHSRLVTVTSEAQACALSALSDLTGKPIPAEPHPTLNTLLPRLASIDKTSPMRFILVDCLIMSDNINPFLINVKNVGVLATQPNIVAPQPDALYVPNLVMTVQIARLSHVHVPIAETPIMCFIGAALPISIFSQYPKPTSYVYSPYPPVKSIFHPKSRYSNLYHFPDTYPSSSLYSPTATSVFLDQCPNSFPSHRYTAIRSLALPPYVPPTPSQDASSSQPPKLNLPPKPHPSLLSLPLPPGYTHESLLSQYPSPDPTVPIEPPDTTTPPIPDPLLALTTTSLYKFDFIGFYAPYCTVIFIVYPPHYSTTSLLSSSQYNLTPHHPIFLSPLSFYCFHLFKPFKYSYWAITCESQACALSTQIDLIGKPIPAKPHSSLNTCTGIVSVSPTNCPMYGIGQTFILVERPALSNCIDPFLINVRNVVVLATKPNTIAPELNPFNVCDQPWA